MKRPKARVAMIALLAACSKLSDETGVVALQVIISQPATVEKGDTLTLLAQALDVDGNVVSEPVYWRTLDSTLIITDTTGRVTTDSLAGSGRVQARAGSLLSDPVSLAIHPPSDTLAITGPSTVTVADGDSASEALIAAVQALNPPSGVPGTVIRYSVVDSLTHAGTVRFAGGVLAFRATTGADGSPATPVTLRRVPGTTQAATVLVEIYAFKPSGDTVAGSAQQFTVNFQ